ncbi:MAG: tetratricopeptide repeat protein [Paucimonas sp.]|jgi:hypothetical protein|nr:tetratricopeptide repeat protein [Paucimonas sp.]
MKRLFNLPLALMLILSGSVYADAAEDQQDLYLDAMRSLSEGRQAEATDMLTRMIEQEPQHAGAWLDLAILQCRLGHADEAERLFGLIESRFAPPPGIREVIQVYRKRGCKWERKSRSSVSLARGSDSNVNQGATNPIFSIGGGPSPRELQLTPEFLPQPDQYTLLSASWSGDLTRSALEGFAHFRMRRNDSLAKYNTATLAAGIEKPWRFGDWRVRGTTNASLITLENRLYQKQAQLLARITPPAFLPERFDVNLMTGLTHVKYQSLLNFDSNTLETGIQLGYSRTNARFQASGGYLVDYGSAKRLGGNRSGWYAGLQGQAQIRDRLIAEASWMKQHWVGATIYSPNLIDKIREQDMQLYRAALIVPFRDHHALQLEWRRVKNNENISLFQYNSRLLQLSWQWQK